MRYFLLFAAAALLAGCQQQKVQPEPVAAAKEYPPGDPNNPPEFILMESPYGNVNYTHKKHYERLNGDCSVCHPKVFPMSKAAPLNYKKALHRASEASRNSCAYCHAVGGTTFAADSNCIKCHVREYPKR